MSNNKKMSTYNYVVSASRETTVSHCVSGAFTGEDSFDVICSKGSRVEIRTLRDERLEVVATVPVFGRVAALKLIRPMQDGQSRDWLFVLTLRMKFFVLAFENGKVVHRGHGSLGEQVSRPVEVPLVAVDPKCRFVVAHVLTGLLSIIPFDSRTGAVKEVSLASLEDLKVLDMVFSAASGKSLLCVLSEDNRDARHVKTYDIHSPNVRELSPGVWSQPHVESSARRLMTVPDGVLVFSSDSIVHLRETVLDGSALVRLASTGGAASSTSQSAASHPQPTTLPIFFGQIEAAGMVDNDGSRILIGDEFGGLHVLSITHPANQANVSMSIELLGETSIASGICYLDGGIVFIGSIYGDSQLVLLLAERDEASQSYIELLETYTNLGPITSMCVMDIDKQGRGQLVTCSGGMKDGSLRIVRNGVGVDEQCAIDLPGIKGMWSLKQTQNSKFDSYLVQSFSTETRVLGFVRDDVAMDANDDEEDHTTLSDLTVSDLFDSSSQTLFCANVKDDWICQVTPQRVRYMRCSALGESGGSREFKDWIAPGGARITIAAGCMEDDRFMMTVALTGGKVLVLSEFAEQVRSFDMEHEVACLAVSEKFFAVGLWTDLSVRIFHIATGKQVHKEKSFGEDALPRSMVLTRFGTVRGGLHLLIGLGDGRLKFFKIDDETGIIQSSWKRTVSLGVQPVELTLFEDFATGSRHVFAACDRPAIVFAAHGDKLVLSNVNVSMEITRAAPFNSEAFPACLALASEGSLVVGTVNDVQRLHVRTVPLGEQPRRIAHQPTSGTLALCTEKWGDTAMEDHAGGDGYGPGVDSPEFPQSYFVRLLDDRTFEVLDSHRMDEMEKPLCIVSMSFDTADEAGTTGVVAGRGGDDPMDGSAGASSTGSPSSKAYFVVGTGYWDEDKDPKRGRILVFEVIKLEGETRRLVLVTEKATAGAVFTLHPFGGKILAGVNAKVHLYKWNDRSLGVGSQSSAGAASSQTPRAPAQSATLSGGAGSVDLLSAECSFHGHVMSLFLRSFGNHIVVGDLLRSVTLLYWDPETNAIVERARDINSRWVTAIEVLDDWTIVMADTSNNMSVFKPDPNLPLVPTTSGPEENGKLSAVGDFHWGDFINVFCKGSLVMRQKQEESEDASGGAIGGANSSSMVSAGEPYPETLSVKAIPTLLFGTASGAIGVLATLTEKEYALLKRLQDAMNEVVEGIAGMKHSDWRAFQLQRDTRPSTGFIDGDLIEMLLEMSHADVEKVAERMNRGLSDKSGTVVTDEPPIVTVTSLVSLVEELTRLH